MSLDISGNDQLVRIYWNLTATGALSLVERVTISLNEKAIPFRLKVVKDPAQFTRCDSSVLYFRKSDYGKVHEAISVIYPQLRNHVRLGIPAFTKFMAEGVGLAESPQGGQSFGMDRCSLLAEGIIAASEGKKQSLQKKIQKISEVFSLNGLKLDYPYLNPQSPDIYREFDIHLNLSPPVQKMKTSVKASSKTFIETALDIGHLLCEQAIWHENKCTWMGKFAR